MTLLPTYLLQDLGPQDQRMSKECGNERMAMLLQYVALGSMIVLTGLAASHVLSEAFKSPVSGRGRGRPR